MLPCRDRLTTRRAEDHGGTLLAIAVLTALPSLSNSASAATCSDYSTQAAADTGDADGDGIYCESLLCPCSRGGRFAGTTASTATALSAAAATSAPSASSGLTICAARPGGYPISDITGWS